MQNFIKEESIWAVQHVGYSRREVTLITLDGDLDMAFCRITAHPLASRSHVCCSHTTKLNFARVPRIAR